MWKRSAFFLTQCRSYFPYPYDICGYLFNCNEIFCTCTCGRRLASPNNIIIWQYFSACNLSKMINNSNFFSTEKEDFQHLNVMCQRAHACNARMLIQWHRLWLNGQNHSHALHQSLVVHFNWLVFIRTWFFEGFSIRYECMLKCASNARIELKNHHCFYTCWNLAFSLFIYFIIFCVAQCCQLELSQYCFLICKTKESFTCIFWRRKKKETKRFLLLADTKKFHIMHNIQK